MEHKEESFKDSDIELDNNDYYGCRFDNCNLIYRGGEPPDIVNCSFSNFRVTFADSAGNTMVFLTKLYHGGFRPFIETTIDNIRGNITPGGSVTH